jgi:hypothetical protein
MADNDKRQAGTCVKWNGIFTNSFLTNQVILPDKALCALETLGVIDRKEPMVFRTFYSLMGRLEHFRGVLEGRRTTTYGMYGPLSLGRLHPMGLIARSPELLTRAREWVVIILLQPGRSCARLPEIPFCAAPFNPADTGRTFFVYTDVALLSAPVPGLGSYLHGTFFSFALPVDMLGYAIPQLEFLAIIASALLFCRCLASASAVLVTDSYTSFLVLNHDGTHAPEIQWPTPHLLGNSTRLR